MQLLNGKSLSKKIQEELDIKTKQFFPNNDKYIGIIYLGNNESSKVYVGLKQKYGEKIGIKGYVFGQYKKGDKLPENAKEDYDVQLYMKQEYDNIGKIIDLIHYLNHDKDCVGIIVQLPLPEEFKKYKSQILSTISPNKDIDGMGGVLNGLSSIDLIDFVPATPKAVVKMLKEYDLYNIRGKIITVIGQSNLVGKPLVLELIKQGATVFSTNSSTPVEKTKELCKMSDIIVSCTGVVHLVNDEFIRDDKSQILIDVGYGHKAGKPVGDVDFESVKDKVKYITPVPGGVGPLTVACLFENIFDIQENLK